MPKYPTRIEPDLLPSLKMVRLYLKPSAIKKAKRLMCESASATLKYLLAIILILVVSLIEQDVKTDEVSVFYTNTIAVTCKTNGLTLTCRAVGSDKK